MTDTTIKSHLLNKILCICFKIYVNAFGLSYEHEHEDEHEHEHERWIEWIMPVCIVNSFIV